MATTKIFNSALMCGVGLAILSAEARAAGIEVVPPNEADQIHANAERITELQQIRKERVSEQQNHVLRGVHPKSHGCVAAKFIVNEKIPEKYRIGLFATPGKEFNAQIRYSETFA